MGLCLLRIISFVVSEWKTTVSWLLLLHRTTLFWEEKMAFLLQTLQYSGYFRQSSWPCLEQSRFGLGLLKDLSALEKLRYWDSQERSFAPSKHSSLPRHSESLCCLHCAPIVSSRLVVSGQHSKSQIFFFRFPSFARVSALQCLYLYFPRLSLASCFSNWT